ncbi:MAG: sulfatase [Candidatus Aminicenantaceae bacterium]
MERIKAAILCFPLVASLIFFGCAPSQAEKPNVLFIAVDDLRPELGCYGNDLIKTPNLDKLASEGCVFTHHFAAVPTCGASRYGLLTGLRPRTRVEIGNEAIRHMLSSKPETEIPETFIHLLKQNGYTTIGIGKIGHYPDGLLYGYEEQPGTERELPHSWDEMLFDAGKWGTGWNAFFAYADGSNRQSRSKNVRPYEDAPVNDNGYPDGLTADMAVEKLRELSVQQGPFFLGVGFFKPHLPFNAPQKYWDLYEESDIPVTPSNSLPENVNRASLHPSTELNQYRFGEEKASLDHPVSDKYARKLRHAYFACVSYVDAQIGRILDELDRQGLSHNTIVVIWGDHGWHLGDHLVWGKHTIFERSLKSVLIFKVPESGNRGMLHDQVISTLDIYPTLLDLCGIELPHATDGRSFSRLLREGGDNTWENLAYSYFRNGISLRTKRYRLTKYFREDMPAIELYDHAQDPFEDHNIAGEFPEIVERLMPLLERGDTGLYWK